MQNFHIILLARHISKLRKFNLQLKYFINMNVSEFNMDKKEFKVYICKKYEGGKDFINKKLDEICSHENVFSKEVIFLCFFFNFLMVVLSLDF